MKPFVFDSSVLSCFARAERLDSLRQLTTSRELFAPRAVLDELRRGTDKHPELSALFDLPWLREASLDDTLPGLVLFAHIARRLGSGDRDIGEASALAWAKLHDGVAIVDDQVAVQAAHDLGIEVRRTLFLIAEGITRHILSESAAVDLVERLLEIGGARLPCRGPDFVQWAKEKGLLPDE